MSMGFSGTPKDMGTPYGKRDPYYSHIFRDSNMGVGLGKSMGPAYHFRGSHVLGGSRVNYPWKWVPWLMTNERWLQCCWTLEISDALPVAYHIYRKLWPHQVWYVVEMIVEKCWDVYYVWYGWRSEFPVSRVVCSKTSWNWKVDFIYILVIRRAATKWCTSRARR